MLPINIKSHYLYSTYANMINRCYVPSVPEYRHYGGRGIKVCSRWYNGDWREGLSNLIYDMGERPDGMTLDRIDNDGPYSPENCQWANGNQQSRNNRNARLTKNDIPRIFEMRSLGMSQMSIAKVIGVSQSSISRVLIGVTWGGE